MYEAAENQLTKNKFKEINYIAFNFSFFLKKKTTRFVYFYVHRCTWGPDPLELEL